MKLTDSSEAVPSAEASRITVWRNVHFLYCCRAVFVPFVGRGSTLVWYTWPPNEVQKTVVGGRLYLMDAYCRVFMNVAGYFFVQELRCLWPPTPLTCIW